MNTEKLNELKKLLEEFVGSDFFGMGEMAEIEEVNNVISFVDGAIISNNEEE